MMRGGFQKILAAGPRVYPRLTLTTMGRTTAPLTQIHHYVLLPKKILGLTSQLRTRPIQIETDPQKILTRLQDSELRLRLAFVRTKIMALREEKEGLQVRLRQAEAELKDAREQLAEEVSKADGMSHVIRRTPRDPSKRTMRTVQDRR